MNARMYNNGAKTHTPYVALPSKAVVTTGKRLLQVLAFLSAMGPALADEGLSDGAIGGICVGGGALLIGIGLLACCCRRSGAAGYQDIEAGNQAAAAGAACCAAGIGALMRR